LTGGVTPCRAKFSGKRLPKKAGHDSIKAGTTMGRVASSKTVSTSTDSSPPAAPALDGIGPQNPRPRKTPPHVVTRLAAAWHAAAAWVSHVLTTPVWRRVKLLADAALLIAAVGAIGWAATNGVFVAKRAADDRAQALVHLGGLPTVRLSAVGSKTPLSSAPPTIVLSGIRSERISLALTNDGNDGVTLKSGTLTGPYFPSPMKLVPFNHGGYVAGHGTSLLIGTVTVDCDAATSVASALVSGQLDTTQPATAVTVSAKDTNGNMHTLLLTVDTTGLAIQGRVCTR
jgi:hypothetical protein